MPTVVDRLDTLRADLCACEAEWQRLDAVGDSASMVRAQTLVERMQILRAKLARAEREERTNA